MAGKETTMTDDELRAMWRNAGGHFHGPRIETGTMPEARLLPFLRELMAAERVEARKQYEGKRDAFDTLPDDYETGDY
jgi:hypothetical protein